MRTGTATVTYMVHTTHITKKLVKEATRPSHSPEHGCWESSKLPTKTSLVGNGLYWCDIGCRCWQKSVNLRSEVSCSINDPEALGYPSSWIWPGRRYLLMVRWYGVTQDVEILNWPSVLVSVKTVVNNLLVLVIYHPIADTWGLVMFYCIWFMDVADAESLFSPTWLSCRNFNSRSSMRIYGPSITADLWHFSKPLVLEERE